MSCVFHHGDCRELLVTLPDCSVDSVVTDPPYELGFMGKSWDASGIAYSVEMWREVLRVLKPGGHLLAFGGARTYHRMAVAIEDAGFDIRDSIHWIYGSGFPKSLDVSKAIDKAAGAEREVVGKHPNPGSTAPRTSMGDGWQPSPNVTASATDAARQWEGWGTALKPAHEPIVVARKPLAGTVAANVLEHGTGALNIDGCRIATDDRFGGGPKGSSGFAQGYEHQGWKPGNELGRWPANVIFDRDAAAELDRQSEGASRFFYVAKPSKTERNAGLDGLPKRIGKQTQAGGDDTRGRPIPANSNHHPTVKPLTLMRYLIRLVTPPNGTVLDPFAGSGTTLMAAALEGFNSIGIELTDDYLPIIKGRVAWAESQPKPEPQVVQEELF